MVKVVHCDLAARNILISEGYLLKIGDFGMARYMSGDPRYQRLQAMVSSSWMQRRGLKGLLVSVLYYM